MAQLQLPELHVISGQLVVPPEVVIGPLANALNLEYGGAGEAFAGDVELTGASAGTGTLELWALYLSEHTKRSVDRILGK